jgi:hypothetical protein
VSSDTDAPTAVTTKGHNSGKNGRWKKSFLYDHLHILLDHLCKFERNPPDSVGGVDATKFGERTDVRTDECNSICLPPCGGIKNTITFDRMNISFAFLLATIYPMKNMFASSFSQVN